MTAAQRERAAIVETFSALGPDAPTLCEGWTARDLAAHLVVRERRLDATPGIMIPALAGYLEKVQTKTATGSGFDDLVGKVASGPPLYSPFKLIDPLINTAEMFIHHEDLRRARPGWDARALPDDLAGALRRPIPLLARLILGKAPAKVTLRGPDGATIARVGKGSTEVAVSGRPEELVLFLFGREVAQVEYDGDPAVVEAVEDSRQSM